MAEKIPISSVEGLQEALDSLGVPLLNPTGALLQSDSTSGKVTESTLQESDLIPQDKIIAVSSTPDLRGGSHVKFSSGLTSNLTITDIQIESNSSAWLDIVHNGFSVSIDPGLTSVIGQPLEKDGRYLFHFRNLGDETNKDIIVNGGSVIPAGGDMNKSVYDPTGIAADAFDWNNFINKPASYPPSSHNHVVADISNLDTDNVPEGTTNKYYSDTLVSANSDVTANTNARHSHANKALLDSLTDQGDGSSFLSNDGIYKPVSATGLPTPSLIQISNSRVVTLNTNPLLILSAPATGKYNNVLEVIVHLNFGNTPYSGGTTLRVVTSDGSIVQSFNNNLASTSSWTEKLVLQELPITTTQDLFLDVATNDPSGGDATLDIEVRNEVRDKPTGNSPDTTPPAYTSTPNNTTPDANGNWTNTITTDEPAKDYLIVVAQGSTAPTVDEVIAGIDYGGITVIASSQDLDADTTKVHDITNTPVGSYDIYQVAVDLVGNKQTSVTSSQITVTDQTPPTYTVAPANGSHDANGIWSNTSTTDEAATDYVIVVAQGATAPTVDEVIAGINYGGVTVLAASNDSASGGVTSHSNSLTVSSNGTYDVYNVAVDTNGNKQTTVTKTSMTINIQTGFTISSGSPETGVSLPDDIVPPTYTVLPSNTLPTPTGDWTNTSTTNEYAKDYLIVVAAGSTAPTTDEVIAGVNYGGVTVAFSSQDLNTSKTHSHTIAGVAQASYDVYNVAVDLLGNKQSSPTKTPVTVKAFADIHVAISASFSIATSPDENNKVFQIFHDNNYTPPTEVSVQDVNGDTVTGVVFAITDFGDGEKSGVDVPTNWNLGGIQTAKYALSNRVLHKYYNASRHHVTGYFDGLPSGTYLVEALLPIHTSGLVCEIELTVNGTTVTKTPSIDYTDQVISQSVVISNGRIDWDVSNENAATREYISVGAIRISKTA